jgi:hypothetical protein
MGSGVVAGAALGWVGFHIALMADSFSLDLLF